MIDKSHLYSSKNKNELIEQQKIRKFKINWWFIANQLIIINESTTNVMVFHRSDSLVPTEWVG